MEDILDRTVLIKPLSSSEILKKLMESYCPQPPKLERPYIPPTKFLHAPRRVGRALRRRCSAARVRKDDDSGDGPSGDCDKHPVSFSNCVINIYEPSSSTASNDKDSLISDLQDKIFNKNQQLRIKDQEIAALKAELELARQEKVALQVELENARQGPKITDLQNYGLCVRVIMMWEEGKTEKEIAAFLYDDGNWCSAAQVGALLYLKEGRVTKEAMQKHGQRLLGKA